MNGCLQWIFFRLETMLSDYKCLFKPGLTQIEQKKEILDLKSHYFGILTP